MVALFLYDTAVSTTVPRVTRYVDENEAENIAAVLVGIGKAYDDYDIIEFEAVDA